MVWRPPPRGALKRLTITADGMLVSAMTYLGGELTIDEFVAASNALAARWARDQCTGRSTVVASVGIWPLLAIRAASADGSARVELETAIGIPAGEGFEAAKALIRLLRSSSAVRAAVGIWHDDRLPDSEHEAIAHANRTLTEISARTGSR